MMKSAKLPQTVKTLSDGEYSIVIPRYVATSLASSSPVLPFSGILLILLFAFIFLQWKIRKSWPHQ